MVQNYLKFLRTEAQFNHFYEKVVTQSSTLTEEPKLPHNQKMPKRYDNGEHPHQYLVPKDKYQHTYFETLELAVGEIERRFEQSDFCTIKEILLLNAANSRDSEPISEVVLKFWRTMLIEVV